MPRKFTKKQTQESLGFLKLQIFREREQLNKINHHIEQNPFRLNRSEITQLKMKNAKLSSLIEEMEKEYVSCSCELKR